MCFDVVVWLWLTCVFAWFVLVFICLVWLFPVGLLFLFLCFVIGLLVVWWFGSCLRMCDCYCLWFVMEFDVVIWVVCTVLIL